MPTVTELADTTTAAVDQLAADWVQDDEDDEKTSRRTLAKSRVSARASTTQTAGTGAGAMGTGAGATVTGVGATSTGVGATGIGAVPTGIGAGANSYGTAAPSSSKSEAWEGLGIAFVVIIPIIVLLVIPYLFAYLQKSQIGLVNKLIPLPVSWNWWEVTKVTLENVGRGLRNLITIGHYGYDGYESKLEIMENETAKKETEEEQTQAFLANAREFFSHEENHQFFKKHGENLYVDAKVAYDAFDKFTEKAKAVAEELVTDSGG